MNVTDRDFSDFREDFRQLQRAIGSVFIGQERLIENTLVCLFGGGHVLLEGMPGLGKTLLAKTLSRSLDLRFARIQCTPDLMPADILGTNILLEATVEGERIRFQEGPLFANIVLADEVNRATPKTQSAFLEAMQEDTVTILGVEHPLEAPFFMIATQNPIELEGTYPLPEAQLDRFFFGLRVEMPQIEDFSRIMDATTGESDSRLSPVLNRELVLHMMTLVRKVKIAERVKRYAAQLVLATHPESPASLSLTQKYVRYGASPRAAQCMILGGKVKALVNGRLNVSCQDIREVARPSLQHRIILNFKGDVERFSREKVIDEVLDRIDC